MAIKPILIVKTANGYIAGEIGEEFVGHIDIENSSIFRTLGRSVSYERDGIEDFLEKYFNPPTPPATESPGAA